jgi:hypothetical protein
MWMSLQEAVERAALFEAMRPHLIGGRILARAKDFYTAEGSAIKQVDRRIDPAWWAAARHDPATDRVYFTMAGMIEGASTWELLAVGVELERAAVDALWPAMTKSSGRKGGGRPPENDWQRAFQYVDDYIDRHGLLSAKERVVELVEDWFRKNDPPPPKSPRTIPNKIKGKEGIWWRRN